MAICAGCGVSFEPKRLGASKYCSPACYYARGPDGPRKASVKTPRQQTAKGHPLAPASGRVAVSRLVLYDKIGSGPHKCHWCGSSLEWRIGTSSHAPDALFVDHLDWDRLNDDPANLVASCGDCNARRAAPGRRNAIQPGELTVPIGKNRTRAVRRVCEACGREFLTSPTKHARFCSRQCANGRGSFGRGDPLKPRRRTQRKCRTCGQWFVTFPSRPAKYCSRTCWANRASPS